MRRPRRSELAPSLLALLLGLGSPVSRAAAEVPYHRLTSEPQVVALTPGLEGAELAAVLDRLEAEGVRIPVAVAGAGLIVVDEPGLDARLAAAGVERVLREAPAEPETASLLRAAPAAAGLLRWWADGFTVPELAPRERQELEAAARDVQICAGARRLEDVLARRPDLRCGPAGFGRVHFAAGRVIVNLVLPESVGANSIYDWSNADEIKVEAELDRALDWWSLKAGGRVTFVLVNRGTAATQQEPALLTIDQEELYIGDCMTSLGFTASSCPYQQLNDMNETVKVQYHSPWAFTQFVLNAESFPASSALAYAYLGGPHTVALRGNGSLSIEELDRVMAHEMGHIFQAADEYSGCGCGGSYGYLEVPNLNCVHCTNPEGKCVMRGSGEYSLQEMHEMETYIHPCSYTKKMAGIYDSNGDGIWDVMDTEPETELTSAVPDTLDDSENFRITGRGWDIPYPANPQRFPEPVTVNHVRRVTFSVDGVAHEGRATDGIFGDVEENFEITLPALGGGTHYLQVQAVNSVNNPDPTPVHRQFFVYDVRLKRDIEVLQEGSDFVVVWLVDGEDLGSTYHLYRRRGAEAPDVLVATVDSQGGRHDRFTYWDLQVPAGFEYIYRLDVDIPGKGTKTLGYARQSALLAPPAAGSFVSIAPNPARGAVQFSIVVPKGPRPNQPDVIIPGAPGLRDEDPWSGGSSGDDLLWRDVRLSVWDVRGRRVRDLGVYRYQETSRFNAAWNGTYRDGAAAPAGVYFLRIQLDYIETIEKLVLVR